MVAYFVRPFKYKGSIRQRLIKVASDPHDFTQGLRIRQTYCVPRNFSDGVENPNEIQIWRKMVDPRKCPGDRPQRIQDCKRLPCPAKWVSLGKLNLLF